MARKARPTAEAGSPAPSRVGRRRARRIVRISLVAGTIAAAAGVGAVAAMFLYYGRDPAMPTLKKLADYHPQQVVRVVDRNGALLGEIGGQKRTSVAYAEIPKVLVNAVVAAEDASYFEHAGLDYRGMLRAFVENVMRGRTVQGGSTITQQVVKGLFLSPERTLRRKIQEIILARQLSDRFSKEEVLELYLNHIYYGHGRYGCEEAARYYFGKAVRDIDLAEASVLAGLPQSPERLSPRKHPEAAKTRQRYVLGQMAAHGFIDRALADKIAGEPIRVAKEPFPTLGLAPEVTDVATRLVRDRLGDRAAELGVTVKTTADARLQALAREALERGLEELDARQGYRGPSGHLEGKALARHRAELAKAHRDGIKESEIFEAVVSSVDVDPDGKGARLVVDIGGGEGVVDLGLEPRYGLVVPKAAKGVPAGKPIAERFAAGDLVRVRLAADRSRQDGRVPLTLELGPQAAMVVLDPNTHEILALVGGYDFRPGGFDRTRSAHRQPGSSWKPFVYAPAIDSGRFTAASILNDAPEVYDLWKPANYEKEEFRGPVRLRTALAHSINTVAIKLLADIGVPAGREAAARIGITSALPDDLGLAMALGAATVTPLELANAYATFASGGQRAEARLVTAIGDESLPAPASVEGLRPETAYVVTSMMKSVIEEGTARAAAGRLRRPAAGKTGTSNGHRDAWFVGFTPDLLCAVWVGFDDERKLGKGEVGGRTAVPIWTEFMAKALEGRPARDFAQPPGVVVVRIDKATGLLAPVGSEGLDEVFIDGTQPTGMAPAAGEVGNPDELLLQ